MNTLQVKVFLLKNGLTLAGMAREMCVKGQSEDAMRVMLSQMIHGHRFYPSLAERIERKYGLRVTPPNGAKAKAA